ncbi:TPA: collagen-like repeat preface domain-containing protein [Bacillus cereus]|nr:collagen-like repeat preface domain-containing protein [Bacillus cereus]
MSHDKKHCNPVIFTAECCNNPQTIPITGQQLNQLISLLNSLITAIASFFADPSDANRLILISLFNRLLDLLNSLIPSPEGNYLKQLIQSILTILQSPTPNLSQLAILLQQFYSSLAPFFFVLMMDPASLQLLLNLLVQLINATPGPTGATGPSGPTGPLVTANNARITNPAIVQVAAGGTVPLSTNNLINGTAITHVPGSPFITLDPNQTYFISYEASTNLGFADQGTSILQFELDGSLVGGTQSEFNLAGLSANFPVATRISQSSDAVINTGAAPSVLTLVNASGHALNVEGTNINIVKIE